MPGGRPTKYLPEYCEAVENMGRDGKSLYQIAAALDICRNTLDLWANANPEFMNALTRAKVFAQSWWEEKGQDALDSKDFNSVVWKKVVESRFRDDYTERKELSGPGGGPIQAEVFTRADEFTSRITGLAASEDT